jgi:5-methyltetrahydropteroyltriglutamate--homocysteine methyltransferase
MMKRSTDRVLTTHTGSLPRTPELIEMLHKLDHDEAVDAAAFQKAVQAGIKDVVEKQIAAGIDGISDGEVGKQNYATYVTNRLTGYEGPPISLFSRGEARMFPEWAEKIFNSSPSMPRPSCSGPVTWKDFAAVQRDIDNFAAAVKDSGATEAFMTSASPGVIGFFLPNQYYKDDEAYLRALGEVMKQEFDAIHKAGFVLQIDCPDLAMSRQSRYVDLSTAEFREVVAMHVDVINEATRDIPPEAMRLHLCWGNYEGPHHLDVELKDIIDIVLTARPNAISFEGANPRHAHEWVVWKDVKLPAEKFLVPGVIDSTTNFIEHPQLVAQRIGNYASVVGRDRVVASVDCGFRTNAYSETIDTRIVWAKLATLAEGARIASKELW